MTDTFLLDVEVQPDLASWWANHTNSSTSNNSGNSSGGDPSDNSTGNGTGSNGTSTTSLSVLMMGNSYTGANNLATLVDGIMDADGYNATLGSLNGGGMKLPEHWSNVNTSGNQWNTTLRGSSWDYVVLQDQSQVPSFYTSNSMWQVLLRRLALSCIITPRTHSRCVRCRAAGASRCHRQHFAMRTACSDGVDAGPLPESHPNSHRRSVWMLGQSLRGLIELSGIDLCLW